MGENGRYEGEIDLPGGSFSRLLLSAEDAHEQSFLMYPSSLPPPLFSANTPKILCFGDFASQTSSQHLSNSLSPTPKPNLSNSLKRRNGSGQEPGKRPGNNGGSTTAGNQTQRNGKTKKKKKNDDNKQPEMGPTPSRTNSAAHAKVRREKLGERIAALQHLVSPYGKTDTASVLHEAMGYIRFLQDQVKVLSSPYLQCLPSSSPPHHLSEKEGEKWTGSITKGLRSRGLCLVPLQCLVNIDNNNGADFWSSAPSTTTPSKP